MRVIFGKTDTFSLFLAAVLTFWGVFPSVVHFSDVEGNGKDSKVHRYQFFAKMSEAEVLSV